MNNEETGCVWHIAGVGAIGTLIATSFCRGNQPVQLILKDESQLAEYQQSQLNLHSDSFNFSCHPPAHCVSTQSYPINYLICCTKAYHVAPLLNNLKDYLTAKSIIILIHNGVGVLDEVRSQLPHLRIISGITTLGGYLEQAYTVRAFLKGSLSLGATSGRFSMEEIRTIKTDFAKSELACEWTEDIQSLIWDKFAINCSINLLTAVFGCKNGELMQHTNLLKQLTQEITLVLNAYEVSINANSLFEKVCTVIQNTADNYSSTYQDIKNNRLTEMHYLNEQLILLAQQKDREVPVARELLSTFYRLFPNQKS
jgi:2-dehydropantoate 2-reductase